MLRIFHRQSSLDESAVLRRLFPDETISVERKEWNVRTKYYDARVTLAFQYSSFRECAENFREENDDLESAEAYVVYIGKDDIMDVSDWNFFQSETWPEKEVQLLVVENEESLTRDFLDKMDESPSDWERIDLSESYDENQVDIFSTRAAERVIEALQTVPWSTLSKKAKFAVESTHKDNKDDVAVVDNNNDDDDDDDFDELFANFAKLKMTADNLPPDQRKKFAENVVLSFWNAMGGDPEEISGLDNDDDVNP